MHAAPSRPFATGNLDLLLGRAALLKNRLLETRLEHEDISAAQFKVMIALSLHRITGLVALARHLDVDTGSLSRMLERLVCKGLISRERDSNDRRQVRIALTAAGVAVSERLPQLGTDAINDMLGPLDAAEVQRLGHILLKVLGAHEPR